MCIHNIHIVIICTCILHIQYYGKHIKYYLEILCVFVYITYAISI